MPPKIIDGFIFYNELELLSYRLKLLNDAVDHFVIVESTHTFVGKEKPLFFEENKESYADYEEKIIHIVVDDMPHIHPNINIQQGQQWKNEECQRNAISSEFQSALSLEPIDYFIISDADEIPDPRSLQTIKKENTPPVEISILQMDLYYYNLNVKFTKKWNPPKILSYKKYGELNMTCSMIRGMEDCPVIQNGGWHLSYFGDYEFMKNKTENYSHQEFNLSDFTDIAKIKERVKNGKDIYDRHHLIYDKIAINDNEYLPINYDKHLTKYYTA